MSRIAILALGGIGAGYVNGLLGTGGGILLVFMLSWLLKDTENKDIYVLTLTVTLVLSGVSVMVYMNKGTIDWTEGLKYGLSAVPGGLVGAYLLDRLRGDTVKKLFGVLIVVAGLNMAGIF